MTAATNNILFGTPIYSDAGVLYTPDSSGGSWDATLTPARLQSRYLDETARSSSASLQSTRRRFDLKADRLIRVVGLLPSFTSPATRGLSSAAYLRVLGVPAAMLFNYEAGEDASLLSGYSFTRATAATYVDRNGVIQTASSGVLRDGHFIAGVRHVLLEPQRTNLCIRSEDFSSWSSGGATVTVNEATAPNGAVTADRVARTSSSVDSRLQGCTFTGDGTKVVSIYLKAGTATQSQVALYDNTAAAYRHLVTVTWTAGVPSLATAGGSGTLFSVEALSLGWYRIAFTAASVVAANTNSVYVYPASNGAGTEYLYAWGAQAEDASYPTSYIATAGSTVQRNADALSVSVVATAGTIDQRYYDLATQAYVVDHSVYSASAAIPFTTGRAFVYTRIGVAGKTQQEMTDMVYDSGWVAYWPSGQTVETLAGLNLAFTQIVNGQTGFTARYWSFQIDDASNANGYIDLSRLAICGGWQPESNAQYGAKMGWRSSTTSEETDGSSYIYNARQARRSATFVLGAMSEADTMTYPWRMDRILGQSGQFWFVWDPTDSTYMHERSFLAVSPEPSEIDYAYYGRQDVPRQVREEL